LRNFILSKSSFSQVALSAGFYFENAAMDIWNKNPERLATQEEKEWLNKCIKAGRFVEKHEKPINFGELNLEDWLRETKKLNLSKKELAKHLNSPKSCKCFEVYDKLKGGNEHEKAEILWNEWNGITGECTLTSQYTFNLTEIYKRISELQCIKPSTIKHKAQLVEVNKKQIFKN